MTSIRNISRYKYKKHLINKKVLNQIIKSSSLCKHAIKELKLAGYKKNENNPIGWMYNQVLESLAVFSSHENSGSSAPFEINLVKKLSSFDIISPLKFDDNEWNLCYTNIYQNIRKSFIFKKDGKIYDIYAFSNNVIRRYSYNTKEWNEVKPTKWNGILYEHKNGIFTGRCFSTCYIKYDPSKGYIPKNTINITCSEIEFAKDDYIMAVDASNISLKILNNKYDIKWEKVPAIKGVRLEDYTSDINKLVIKNLNKNK